MATKKIATKPKTRAEAVAAADAFVPAAKKAGAAKRREQENKQAEGERILAELKQREHFSDADMQILHGRETGELPRSTFGAVAPTPEAAENFEAIFGHKPTQGQAGGLTGLTKNGRPLNDREVELIGYANTDQGEKDPAIQAEIAKLRAGMGETSDTQRVKVHADEWDNAMLRRAEIQNKAGDRAAAAGAYGGEDKAMQIIEEMQQEMDQSNPRTAAEKKYLPAGWVPRWASWKSYESDRRNSDGESRIAGYVVIKNDQGDPVRVSDSVLTGMPEAIRERVMQPIYEKHRKRVQDHIHSVAGNDERREIAEGVTISGYKPRDGAGGKVNWRKSVNEGEAQTAERVTQRPPE